MATQKIHFFTGKGGVGKSALAASFACALSQKTDHSPVLLTELTERSFFQDFLQLPQIGYKPILAESISVDLSVCQWSTTECLKEYALHLLKIETLYKLFFENPVSKSLIQVAPGLQELAILGKATSSARKHGPKMEYSQIVIDAFSTGHFMSLFRAPKAMSEVISFGPMGEQSRSIDTWLRNSEYCEVHLVTLAEELPITETIELYKNLKLEFGITAKVYLNKTLCLAEDDFKNLSVDEKKYFLELSENETVSAKKLSEAGIEFIKINFIPEPDTISLVQKISTNILGDKL
jgi:anion-transporting  ArsA/GET3 family ATPase